MAEALRQRRSRSAQTTARVGGVKLQPVERQTVQDRVYAELRRALILGLFEPGQVLTIQDLADNLNTSTMPVREALARLVSEQALEALANRSARVPLITPSRLDDLLHARVTVEGAALERAMSNFGDSDLAQLESITDAYDEKVAKRACVRADARELAIRLNQEFHFHIYRAARSSVLLPIIESLWLQSGPFVRAAVTSYAHDEGVGASHYHREIIAGIRAGNAAAARAALASDIGRSFDLLREDARRPGDER